MIVTLTLRTQTVTLTVAALNTNNGGGSGVSVHNQLTGRDTADAHPQSAVTGLVAALAAKAASDHTHASVYEPANANLQAHVASTSNPHSTTAAQVGADAAGTAATAVGALAATLGTAATKNVGTTAGTVAAGDDARLSDAREPTAHNQDANTITTGTLDAARLPAPGTATLGGVKRNTGSAGQFVTGVDTDGSLLRDTPAGASPAGSDTQPQYNAAGSFAGMAGVAWDNTNRAETRTGATVTTSNPVQSFTQTWNSSGVTFTGWKIDITDTASAAASLIADFRVGGVTKFAVRKDGVIQAIRYGNMGGGSSGGLDFLSGATRLLGYNGVAGISLGADGGVIIPTHLSFGVNYFTPDAFVYRDAANALNMRNGTSAQTLRVSGTHTDASNYVRALLAATSTAVTLAAETAGTGADDVPVRITPAGVSQVEIGNGVQFTEMTAPSAPAANKVILFAQDNGAGKTQLMALFASGAAQQVAIEP